MKEQFSILKLELNISHWNAQLSKSKRPNAQLSKRRMPRVARQIHSEHFQTFSLSYWGANSITPEG